VDTATYPTSTKAPTTSTITTTTNTLVGALGDKLSVVEALLEKQIVTNNDAVEALRKVRMPPPSHSTINHDAVKG
jgi:hypothetical protein